MIGQFGEGIGGRQCFEAGIGLIEMRVGAIERLVLALKFLVELFQHLGVNDGVEHGVDTCRDSGDLVTSNHGETGVELTLLTRDPAHCEEILTNLARWGYPAERLA